METDERRTVVWHLDEGKQRERDTDFFRLVQSRIPVPGMELVDTGRTRQSIDPWMTQSQGTTEYRVIE